MDAGFIAAGAVRSVTERSVSQNGALPDVLLSLNAEPIAPAKWSRERLAIPPYRCSDVSGFFAAIPVISPAGPLLLFGRLVSRGSILPPPPNAARGADAHAIAVATLPPKNTRRETDIIYLLLSESQLTSYCLAGRNPENWNIGKTFGGI